MQIFMTVTRISFHKKLASLLATILMNSLWYTMPLAHFLDSQYAEMNNAQGLTWNRISILFRGCVVSILSITSNVCVGLFLALVDTFLPVWHIFVNIQLVGLSWILACF